MLTTSNAPRAFKPEEVHSLVIQPAMDASIAAQLSTVIHTNANTYRVPLVAADPTAEWVAEGDEIDITDATLAEAFTSFGKLAGLTIVTNELAADASPEATSMVGQGLARDIARKLDLAFFGSNIVTPGAPPVRDANQPQGLEDLTGVNTVTVTGAWANADPFIEAQYDAEGKASVVTSWVANPADALALAQVKETAGSNRNLLQPDATAATRRALSGLPLFTSPAVTPGTVWGLPKLHSLLVIRKDVTLDVDRSAFFTSDRTAIRGILRAGFVHTNPAAVQKIILDTED